VAPEDAMVVEMLLAKDGYGVLTHGELNPFSAFHTTFVSADFACILPSEVLLILSYIQLDSSLLVPQK